MNRQEAAQIAHLSKSNRRLRAKVAYLRQNLDALSEVRRRRCDYCGAPSYGRACMAHSDLLEADLAGNA